MRDRFTAAGSRALTALLALGPTVARAQSQETPGRLTTAQFRELIQKVERGWSTQDTDLALSAFTADAIYMEPPSVQLYRGHAELRPYFGALTPGTVEAGSR